MKLSVNCETETWLTQSADPDDEWDRDSYDGRVVNVSVRETNEEASTSWYSDLIVELDVSDGDYVYAVVVDYSTGDTFGRDGGYSQVIDVFDNSDDADNLLELAMQYDTGNRRIIGPIEYKGKEYYAAWTGYFECTNSIDIWKCIVNGKSKSPYKKGK